MDDLNEFCNQGARIVKCDWEVGVIMIFQNYGTRRSEAKLLEGFHSIIFCSANPLE